MVRQPTANRPVVGQNRVGSGSAGVAAATGSDVSSVPVAVSASRAAIPARVCRTGIGPRAQTVKMAAM
ncbi:hypothetical protein BLA60_34410 [Actinophytocola xinjiangensis]|uniref:Uncharacterized protein n=1 Tax=Actinophytocola xinjiangensis TaxID=485602 RepID=A0A7Z0WF52_9PSEU|nr:hypothetical protein BLA60_34410 [Actinophytocola xinjiangensis]